MRRKIAILGSTGSIGTQALDVIARHRDRFTVVGLAAGRNVALLREQAARFAPEVATSIDDGLEGLHRVAVESGADIVLAATDGTVAFDAVFAAVDRGIDIAVANKELVVAAGELLVARARRSGARLLPVDSEHSAIFQCLLGEDRARVSGIVVTASGGPFRCTSLEEMAGVTVAQALAHPTWRMGVKNSVDSATLMNKGLEVIEASRLFEMPGERIGVVVHPQSVAHGMVVFTDGSVKAQLCAPDMRVPIGYALAYPDRLVWNAEPTHSAASFDPLAAAGAQALVRELRYDFERPDLDRFPCLQLAYAALAAGGTAATALSAANEVAVEAFVGGELPFLGIAHVVERVLVETPVRDATLENVRAVDAQARMRAAALIESKRNTWSFSHLPV